ETVVVIVAVAIVFGVGVVVFVVVADQILQRETVVRGDEIDAGPGLAAMVIEQMRRALQRGCQSTALILIAAPITSQTVAAGRVPFGKTRRMIAELKSTRPDIPGFGDQFHARQKWILQQRIEQSCARIKTIRLAA